MKITWYNKENDELNSVKVRDTNHIDYYMLDFVWSIKNGFCVGDKLVIEEELEDQKNGG